LREVAKAVAKIVDDAEPLFASYDFPEEDQPDRVDDRDGSVADEGHQGVPGSRAAGLAMAFKLIEAAESRGGRSTRPTSSPSSRAGAKFEKGVLIERTTTKDQGAA
jgi:hypothetical protein